MQKITMVFFLYKNITKPIEYNMRLPLPQIIKINTLNCVRHLYTNSLNFILILVIACRQINGNNEIFTGFYLKQNVMIIG